MIRPGMVALAGLLLATIAAAPPPSVDTARGRALFGKWCAPCHADNPRLAGTLALKTKYAGAVPAALEQRTDLTPETVGYVVRHGVAWMAPFRKTEISDAELAAIGAYLSTPPGKRH